MSKPDPVVSAYFSSLQKRSARSRWSGKSKKERSEMMKAVALAKIRKKSLLGELKT